MLQGRILRPYTEKFFRAAGVVPGMRVLDVGSGMGDVALLAADMVGPGGRVLGIDRDAAALEQRAAACGRARLLLLGLFSSCESGRIRDGGYVRRVGGPLRPVVSTGRRRDDPVFAAVCKTRGNYCFP